MTAVPSAAVIIQVAIDTGRATKMPARNAIAQHHGGYIVIGWLCGCFGSRKPAPIPWRGENRKRHTRHAGPAHGYLDREEAEEEGERSGGGRHERRTNI